MPTGVIKEKLMVKPSFHFGQRSAWQVLVMLVLSVVRSSTFVSGLGFSPVCCLTAMAFSSVCCVECA